MAYRCATRSSSPRPWPARSGRTRSSPTAALGWSCCDPTRQAKWLTAIATKPAEVDELVKAHPEGATVLHLGPPIRAVLTASLERAEAEQRELA